MKSILVADNRPDLLATLEPILKHWGYRVLSTSKTDQAVTFLQASEPCLLIIGEELLASPKLAIDPLTAARIGGAALPIIALKQNRTGAAVLTPSETLEVPVGLFELYSFIQRNVEHHPRHNLRLRLRLPGMYSMDEQTYTLAEVLSLSTQGLFFKAAPRCQKGDRLSVVFPLFGHFREIEVKAQVLYVIQPGAANNYFQGFGVGFDDLSACHQAQLQHFIREHFLKEVTASRNGIGGFAEEQLKQ